MILNTELACPRVRRHADHASAVRRFSGARAAVHGLGGITCLGGCDLRAVQGVFVMDAVEEFVRHGKPVRVLLRFARPVILCA